MSSNYIPTYKILYYTPYYTSTVDDDSFSYKAKANLRDPQRKILVNVKSQKSEFQILNFSE